MIISYLIKAGPIYLHHNQFSVGSASEEYPLTVEGFTAAGVGTDWFADPRHNGMKFLTPDNDNDKSNVNCAANIKMDGGIVALTSKDNHLM